MIPGSAIPALISGADAAGGYSISRSLRFNLADSAYLSRTPASAGNRKTWTWAGWVKRSKLGENSALFGRQQSDDTNTLDIRFGTGDTLRLANWNTYILETTQVFRDTSAWFHLVVVLDTTQATANNRARMYVNGAEITQFGARSNPTQNADLAINNTTLHHLGATVGGGGGVAYPFNGYLADIHFIDGQALTPSSFGEFSATTGVWVPKAYTGTYGTNGFRLDFSDNSAATATTLGKDRAGSNNWTPNNLSVTAGAGNDSLVDTPTSYGTDTGAGGEVRGNYATLNPLAKASAADLSNGNLEFRSTSSWAASRSTIQLPSTGKWYVEFTLIGNGRNGSDRYAYFGVCTEGAAFTDSGSGSNYLTWTDGHQAFNFSGTNIDGSPTNKYSGGVVGLRLDRDNNTFAFYYDGSAGPSGTIGVASGTPLYYVIGHYPGYTTSIFANFGQRPFAYTAPSGFKALCTANLPAPTIVKPSTVFDTKLYTGNGSTQTISGLGFSPDLVWIKNRSTANAYHVWFDTLRGAHNALLSNTTGAEANYSPYGVTAFNADGFSIADTTNGDYSTNGPVGGLYSGAAQNVAWAWDAGSSTVTNTQGSISSQVRANVTAGFSVVTAGAGGYFGGTLGHGLGVAPSMIIVKDRNGTTGWRIYHSSLGNNFYGDFSTAAFVNYGSNLWGATSSVFGSNVGLTITAVAYCFAPVVGYSSFGSYVGNGSADGPFVYTGFRPRFLLLKCSSVGDAFQHWHMFDSARNTYNQMNARLQANSSAAEDSFSVIDFTSNGFKLRYADAYFNQSGATYIYAAFAEAPFQYARAR